MTTAAVLAPAGSAVDRAPEAAPATTGGGRHRPPGAWSRHGPGAFVVTALARGLLVMGVVLLLWTLLPALGGWQSTLVRSGSMAPGIRSGDVAVVRPLALDHLSIGQVLLVTDPDRPERLRLHRLADVVDGRLVLRGDANPEADSSPVDPASVHGVVVLRIPSVGLPAVWAAEGRTARVVASGVLLALVVAAAGWHRPRSGEGPLAVGDLLDRLGLGPVPRAPGGRRGTSAGGAVAVLVTLSVLGSAGVAVAAPYFGTALNAGNSVASTPFYTCANAAHDGSSASPGPNRALRYHGLQEASGTTAANGGSAGATANGTYVGTPVFTTSGPPGCGAGGTRAVTFNGSTQWVNTALTGTAPSTVSVSIWFRTTTTAGGRLIGFGNEVRTNGQSASTQTDRHLYMTNTGRVAFGVLAGTTRNAVLSTASYNDGLWHHAVGTLSSAGMVLYVDGVQVGASTATTTATAASYTGAWRVAYDVLTGWPSAPTSPFLAGTLAHASVHSTALTAAQVAAHYRAGT